MAPSFINSTMFARPCRQKLRALSWHRPRCRVSPPQALQSFAIQNTEKKNIKQKATSVFPSFSTKLNTAKPPPFSSITEKSITVWLKLPHIV